MNSIVSLVCVTLLFQGLALEFLLGKAEFTQRFNLVTSGVIWNIVSDSALHDTVAFKDVF